MARSSTAGSKPAASTTAKTPVKRTKQKAAAVKKTTSAAPLKLARPAKAGAQKRPSAKPPAAKVPPRKTVEKKRKKAASSAAAAPARVTPAKPAFGAKFLAQQEKALLEERDNYTRQAESLRAEADALVADFEPGDVQFDEESGEGDTLNTERERDLALSAQAQQAVEEISHALNKFADGTYGICEISGDPIPVERLEAIPWARERVEYKIGGLGRR